MAIEDNWNCEDEIDKLFSQVPQPMDSFPSNELWDDEIDKLLSQVPQPMNSFSSNKPWDHKLDQLIKDPKPATNTQPGSHSGSSTKASAGQTTAVDNRLQSVTAIQIKKVQESYVSTNTKKAILPGV